MKKIPLTQGKVALVDDADYPKVAKYKWFLRKEKYTGYAARSYKKPDGRVGVIRMHRLILDAPSHLDVDHINGNGLDNRRCNIRLCTRQENVWNTRARHGKTSRYKGVCWDKASKKWKAQINIDGKKHSIGRFTKEKEAAKAYQKKAKEAFGEFAYDSLLR